MGHPYAAGTRVGTETGSPRRPLRTPDRRPTRPGALRPGTDCPSRRRPVRGAGVGVTPGTVVPRRRRLPPSRSRPSSTRDPVSPVSPSAPGDPGSSTSKLPRGDRGHATLRHLTTSGLPTPSRRTARPRVPCPRRPDRPSTGIPRPVADSSPRRPTRPTTTRDIPYLLSPSPCHTGRAPPTSRVRKG